MEHQSVVIGMAKKANDKHKMVFSCVQLLSTGIPLRLSH